MGADQHLDWAASARSVLDWWREAGVDVLVDDAPRDWLAAPPPPAPAIDATAAPVVAAAALPDNLDAFLAWRVGDDAPEGAQPGAVLAEGDPAAAIAIVVDFADEHGLIGGVAGALFDRMLAAIGLSRESVYLVALTTARPLNDRLAPDMLPRLGQLTRHHLSLATPQRVLLLGQAASRAVVGTDGRSGPGILQPVNLNTVEIPAVSSLHPRFLLKQPAMKAEAWKDLQLLMGGPR
ncbi:uracil-DNA glycosylase family protein [Sphingomonas floccifaciens]|uniref:Uracil-DNA glycosylase family protein n=1 Tax=Sphingomonas floccifaciens TaxID=1844115 RepID=A0ABW4NF56_9SPHN